VRHGRRPRHGRTARAGTSSLTYFLLGAGSFLALYLPQPILPLLDRQFGTNPAVTGLTMTAGLLGFAVSGLLPEGDPRRTLRRALWLIVAASLVAALSPSFAILLAARAAQGIGVGLLVAGGLADIARNHPAALGGRLTGSMIGGTAIGGLISRLTGYSALWLGWRAAFAIGGVLALLLCSLALNRLSSTSSDTGRDGEVSPRKGGGAGAGAGAAAPEAPEEAAAPAGAAAALAAPLGLVVAGLGILFVNIAVFDLLPYRLAGSPFHLSPALADFVYLAFLPALLTAGLAGRAIDRFGARAVVVATAVIGICCLLAGLLPNLVAAALMATGSISGAVALHTSHSGAAAARGRVAVGRYLTAYYVGGALAAPVMAAAYQAWGWTGVVLPLCAAWAGVGLLALFSPASRWLRESGPGAPPRDQLPAAP
jgi:YNFM family putative membrane transporter